MTRLISACVKPEWDKGIIRKRIGISSDHKKVLPITTYDVEKMTHYQRINFGDCIFTVTFDLVKNKIRTELATIYSGRVMRCPSFKCSEMEKRLAVMKDVSNIMFSDFGSYVELEYSEMSDIKDIKPYEEFLEPMKLADEEMYVFVIQEMKYSKFIDVLMDWEYAIHLPQWLNNRSRLTTDKANMTVKHTSEHWLLGRKDGSWYIPDLEPTKGAHINAETQRTIKIFDSTPLAMPDDVDRAIKFILGVHVVDGHTRGVSWTLYKRP